MTDDARNAIERRVLILAPTGRDAQLTQEILAQEGFVCAVARSMSGAGSRNAGSTSWNVNPTGAMPAQRDARPYCATCSWKSGIMRSMKTSRPKRWPSCAARWKHASP